MYVRYTYLTQRIFNCIAFILKKVVFHDSIMIALKYGQEVGVGEGCKEVS